MKTKLEKTVLQETKKYLDEEMSSLEQQDAQTRQPDQQELEHFVNELNRVTAQLNNLSRKAHELNQAGAYQQLASVANQMRRLLQTTQLGGKEPERLTSPRTSLRTSGEKWPRNEQKVANKPRKRS